MIDNDNKQRKPLSTRRMLRWIGILCILSILLALLAACSWLERQPPSDEAVIKAAQKFAAALQLAGKNAQEILAQAQEEAKKWGPKAQLFIDTVIKELQK